MTENIRGVISCLEPHIREVHWAERQHEIPKGMSLSPSLDMHNTNWNSKFPSQMHQILILHQLQIMSDNQGNHLG